MKTVYIVSDMISDTPTTKVEKFRFSFLAQNRFNRLLEMV
jgi:hypothetical protein